MNFSANYKGLQTSSRQYCDTFDTNVYESALTADRRAEVHPGLLPNEAVL